MITRTAGSSTIERRRPVWAIRRARHHRYPVSHRKIATSVPGTITKNSKRPASIMTQPPGSYRPVAFRQCSRITSLANPIRARTAASGISARRASRRFSGKPSLALGLREPGQAQRLLQVIEAHEAERGELERDATSLIGQALA